MRSGLPRAYARREDDLATLRGHMNVQRPFTVHAVRPDRLACRFNELSPDTPLMRVMAGAVACLNPFARAAETQRKIMKLHHRLADVPALPPAMGGSAV